MTQKVQKRLGVKLNKYGSHVLRHACATPLPAQGLTLKDVGDHPGHRPSRLLRKPKTLPLC
jgi:integrase/recombinase XerD